MSYFITGTGLITKFVKLADAVATDVLDEERATTVASIVCTETAGATPDLTIGVYDPDDVITYYLRNATAMTANETVTYNEPLVVPPSWKVRVTSSDAGGGVDVFINYFNPNSSGRTG